MSRPKIPSLFQFLTNRWMHIKNKDQILTLDCIGDNDEPPIISSEGKIEVHKGYRYLSTENGPCGTYTVSRGEQENKD